MVPVESAMLGRDAGTMAEFCWAAGLFTPKQVNFDFSATKGFRLAERQTLQFRAKIFNAPNHVELVQPGHGLGKLQRATAGHLWYDYLDQSEHAPDSIRS